MKRPSWLTRHVWARLPHVRIRRSDEGLYRLCQPDPSVYAHGLKRTPPCSMSPASMEDED